MAGVPESNRQGLKGLYENTGGQRWIRSGGWLTDVPFGRWDGVETTGGGEVVGLDLSFNSLQGNMPDSLSSLTALQGLYLNNNQLSGNIADSLSSLTALQGLHLNNNQLSGNIPDSLSSLTALQGLHLSHNQLGGNIPDSLSSLTTLYWLYLNNNQLSGNIPDSLSSLTSLRLLHLNNNQLSGNIPDSLSSLTALQGLHLNNNQLSGNMPDSLSSLTALQGLYLSNNQLSGNMPDSLSSLTALYWLYLNNNQLSDGFVDHLRISHGCHLRFHMTASCGQMIHVNTFDGEVPSSFTSLVMLRGLTLSGNAIDNVPVELERTLPDADAFWMDVIQRGRNERGERERSWLRRGVNGSSKFWHVIIPVVDDVTDYILLVTTVDERGALWWICLVALALADADRAYALLYLVVVMTTMIFVVLVAVLNVIVEYTVGSCGVNLLYLNLWWLAGIISGNRAQEDNVSILSLDAVTWTVLGPRARYSHEDFGGNGSAAIAQNSGSEVKIIDKFLEWHPYRWIGQFLFRGPHVLKIPSGDREKSRRALVMLRAVGETVVVDILFLFLGLMTSGSLNDISSVALLSSMFSVLELVIELQHYVNEAEPYLVQT